MLVFALQITATTYVCSAHFLDTDYTTPQYVKRALLMPSAVPSQFVWTLSKKKRKPPVIRESLPSSGKAMKRRATSETNNSKAQTSSNSLGHASTKRQCTITKSSDHTTVEVSDTMPNNDIVSNITTVIFRTDHDYDVQPISQSEQLEAARQRIQELEDELEKVRVEKFGLERFSNDPKLIRFYTGFPTYNKLKSFFQCIAPHAVGMLTWTQQQRTGKKSYFGFSNSKLRLFDRFFMFLHKLRLGSFDQELADKFGVSQSTVSRNTITWANFLYILLGSQPLWPTRQQVQDYMPSSFRALYPNTRVVLDCTEVAVQAPSSLMLRSEFYSSYKSRTTLKCLIGVTPAGSVSFISSLYAGSISDKSITKASGILDLLESGDTVMVDKGFLIEDLLAERNCSLVIPNFLSHKGQFSAEEVKENKIIANLRVHIERANRRFKEFHLFDSALPLVLAGTANQLWTVACMLTNFQNPLILNNDCAVNSK